MNWFQIKIFLAKDTLSVSFMNINKKWGLFYIKLTFKDGNIFLKLIEIISFINAYYL